MSPQKKNRASAKKAAEKTHRIIIDLKIRGMSLNEIQRHLYDCHQCKYSIRKIRNLVIRYGKKAEKANRFYDHKVLPLIQIAEADEIHQGRNGIYIGIAEKFSTYLVSLAPVSSKNKDDFLAFFAPLQDQLPNLKAWITDGLPTYNAPMDEQFQTILHIVCHVHTYRDAMKAQDKYNRSASRKYMKLKEQRQKLTMIEEHIHHHRKQLERFQIELNTFIQERDQFLRDHNIPKYSKTQKYAKKRQNFREKIGLCRSNVKSYSEMIQSWEKKKIECKMQISKLETDYQSAKNIALQSGRIVARFKDLLDCSADKFPEMKQKMQNFLSQTPYPIGKKIFQILKNKEKIFNDKTPEIQALIPPNRVNTNEIESIFGRYRLFFAKYRKMTDTAYANAVFQLLRLHHNLSAPYTGPNREISPIRRIGIQTKFNNILEYLFGEFE